MKEKATFTADAVAAQPHVFGGQSISSAFAMDVIHANVPALSTSALLMQLTTGATDALSVRGGHWDLWLSVLSGSVSSHLSVRCAR
jgi:hypothetical protein